MYILDIYYTSKIVWEIGKYIAALHQALRICLKMLFQNNELLEQAIEFARYKVTIILRHFPLSYTFSLFKRYVWTVYRFSICPVLFSKSGLGGRFFRLEIVIGGPFYKYFKLNSNLRQDRFSESIYSWYRIL